MVTNIKKNQLFNNVPSTQIDARSSVPNELQAAELLLMNLQKYIISQRWHTGIGGERVFFYKPSVNEKGEQQKNITSRITVPHHVAHQLHVIERYLLIRTNHEKQLPKEELILKARLAITLVFKDIPERATRKTSAFSQFFKRMTRNEETKSYYELFTLDFKNRILRQLGLELNEDVNEFLKSLLHSNALERFSV